MRETTHYLIYREGMAQAERIAQEEGLPLAQVLRQAQEGGPLWRRHKGMPQVRAALEAREAFLEANRPLVHYHLHRLKAPPELWEDLEAAGMAGLLRALELYQPGKAAFSTYASLWIRQAVEREKARLLPQGISLEEPLPDAEGLTLGDTLAAGMPGPEERALWTLEEEGVWKRIRLAAQEGWLGEEEALALGLELGVAPGYPQVQGVGGVAQAMGVSPWRAKGLLRRGKEALRRAWEEEALAS